jgi:branched-chain amino acid aminotransferase
MHRLLLSRARILRKTAPPAPANNIDWPALGFAHNMKELTTMVNLECPGDKMWSGINHPIEQIPYRKIELEPSATVLNYGQGIFEGIKAHRTVDDRIVVFRPEMNGHRLAEGADALCMPPVPMDLFLKAMQTAVQANGHLCPPSGNGALYLRPILFGSGPTLGLAPSTNFTFLTYAAPVGEYYKGAIGGARMKIERNHDRAAPNGVGCYKVGGNYAPCFKYQKKAKGQGYNDVLYFDSVANAKLEEVAAANMFVVLKDKVKTPKLAGTILPGVTRNSICQLVRDGHTPDGRPLEEGDVSLEDLQNAEEVFCCGTATVMTPIQHIGDTEDGGSVSCDYQPMGPVTTQLYNTLTGIMSGKIEDKHGWIRDVYDDTEFLRV